MEVQIKATLSFVEDEEEPNDYYQHQNYDQRNANRNNANNVRKKLEKLNEDNYEEEYEN